MPIKEKEKSMIKLGNQKYEDIKEFLADVFYRDKNLTDPAFEIMRLIYDRKELGMEVKNWKEHISNTFNIEHLNEEESEQLKKVYQRFYTSVSAKGAKPYQTLLKRAEKGEISLSSAEKEIIEKSVKWNASVSTYYSVLNKLAAIGLIEKKEGRYYKSRKILDQFKSIEKAISDFEVQLRS